MIKEKYEELKMTVIDFDGEDVLTASGTASGCAETVPEIYYFLYPGYK